jgi:hypothetical protein
MSKRILRIVEKIVYQTEVPEEVTEENAFDWLETNDAWPKCSLFVEDRLFEILQEEEKIL